MLSTLPDPDSNDHNAPEPTESELEQALNAPSDDDGRRMRGANELREKRCAKEFLNGSSPEGQATLLALFLRVFSVLESLQKETPRLDASNGVDLFELEAKMDGLGGTYDADAEFQEGWRIVAIDTVDQLRKLLERAVFKTDALSVEKIQKAMVNPVLSQRLTIQVGERQQFEEMSRPGRERLSQILSKYKQPKVVTEAL